MASGAVVCRNFREIGQPCYFRRPNTSARKFFGTDLFFLAHELGLCTPGLVGADGLLFSRLEARQAALGALVPSRLVRLAGLQYLSNRQSPALMANGPSFWRLCDLFFCRSAGF